MIMGPSNFSKSPSKIFLREQHFKIENTWELLSLVSSFFPPLNSLQNLSQYKTGPSIKPLSAFIRGRIKEIKSVNLKNLYLHPPLPSTKIPIRQRGGNQLEPQYYFVKSQWITGCSKNSSQKFTVIQAFKKQENFQINNLNHHLKELAKEEQNVKSAEGRTE